MQYMIRHYQPSDIVQCRGLWLELVEHHREIYQDPDIGGPDPGAEFDEYLRRPGLHGPWVVETQSTLAGLSGLLVTGTEGQIEPFVLARLFRGTRIGSDLMRYMIEEARKHDVQYLTIRPVARNIQAIASFYQAGFRLLGQIDMFMELPSGVPEKWRSGVKIHGRLFGY